MPSPGALEIAWADSEVHHARWHGHDVHLAFAVAAATRQGAGEVPVDGFLQGLTLVLYRCAPVPTDALFGRLRGGCVRSEGQPPRPRLPVPFRWKQALVLELELAHGGLLVLPAQGLECRLDAGGIFRESLFC